MSVVVPEEVMNVLEHCRDKIQARTRKPWWDMQQKYFMKDNQRGVMSKGELQKALEHYAIRLSAANLNILWDCFPMRVGSDTGFDFKAFAKTLFPRTVDEDRPGVRNDLVFQPDFYSNSFGQTFDNGAVLGYPEGHFTNTRPAASPPASRGKTPQSAKMRVNVVDVNGMAYISSGVKVHRLVNGKRGTVQVVPDGEIPASKGVPPVLDEVRNSGDGIVYITRTAYDNIGELDNQGSVYGLQPAKKSGMFMGQNPKPENLRTSKWH